MIRPDTTPAAELLTLAAAAERLSVSPATVERLIAAGALAAYDLAPGPGRRMIRIEPAELEEFLHARRHAAATPPASRRRRRPRTYTRHV